MINCRKSAEFKPGLNYGTPRYYTYSGYSWMNWKISRCLVPINRWCIHDHSTTGEFSAGCWFISRDVRAPLNNLQTTVPTYDRRIIAPYARIGRLGQNKFAESLKV